LPEPVFAAPSTWVTVRARVRVRIRVVRVRVRVRVSMAAEHVSPRERVRDRCPLDVGHPLELAARQAVERALGDRQLAELLPLVVDHLAGLLHLVAFGQQRVGALGRRLAQHALRQLRELGLLSLAASVCCSLLPGHGWCGVRERGLSDGPRAAWSARVADGSGVSVRT
jgi:hypothetical protein